MIKSKYRDVYVYNNSGFYFYKYFFYHVCFAVHLLPLEGCCRPRDRAHVWQDALPFLNRSMCVCVYMYVYIYICIYIYSEVMSQAPVLSTSVGCNDSTSQWIFACGTTEIMA